MKINQLIELAHNNAVRKGFWNDDKKMRDALPDELYEIYRKESFAAKLALIHGEVSETLEDKRDNRGDNEIYFEGEKPCGIPIELADTVIRIADLAGFLGIDLEKAIKRKLLYNATRPFKHGKKL